MMGNNANIVIAYSPASFQAVLNTPILTLDAGFVSVADNNLLSLTGSLMHSKGGIINFPFNHTASTYGKMMIQGNLIANPGAQIEVESMVSPDLLCNKFSMSSIITWMGSTSGTYMGVGQIFSNDSSIRVVSEMTTSHLDITLQSMSGCGSSAMLSSTGGPTQSTVQSSTAIPVQSTVQSSSGDPIRTSSTGSAAIGSSSKLSGGAIAGICVAVIGISGLGGVLAYFFFFKKPTTTNPLDENYVQL